MVSYSVNQYSSVNQSIIHFNRSLNNLLKINQFSDESDDETTFGDGEEEEADYDRFGRLEQCRAELEAELGIEKLIAVYQAIQVLQFDFVIDFTSKTKRRKIQNYTLIDTCCSF